MERNCFLKKFLIKILFSFIYSTIFRILNKTKKKSQNNQATKCLSQKKSKQNKTKQNKKSTQREEKETLLHINTSTQSNRTEQNNMDISSTVTPTCPIDMPSAKWAKSEPDMYSHHSYSLKKSGTSSHRVSLDAGYESLLSTSSNSGSFYATHSFLGNHSSNPNATLTKLNPSNGLSTNNPNFVGSYSASSGGHSSDASNFSSSDDSNSVVFSQPCTPVKCSAPSTVYGCNNSARTPDHKQQLVADVSAFYFASIRASAHKSETAPVTSCFGQFSASNSNSPVKYNLVAQSPKFVVHADSYIHQRDSLTSKLLRSPAFKISSRGSSLYSQQDLGK